MTNAPCGDILVVDPENLNGRLRVITINRPQKRNALNDEMLRKLIFEIRTADEDLRIRALIITGAGTSAFCAGADLSAIVGEEGSIDGISAFGELFLTLQQVGVPVIAAVNGVAVGGGLGIVLASDLVVMSMNAQIGAPEVKRGLFAMYISRLVYQSFPEKVANKMLLTGEMLDAAKLLELNIVNQLVNADEVLTSAMEMAKPLCELSGAVLRAGKRAIRRQRDFDFTSAMHFLGEELKSNLALNDSREGISAFLQKRAAKWTDS